MATGIFWQHVYFFVILTIGAMLLVSFVVISYETSKQRTSMHNCAVDHNKCREPPQSAAHGNN